MQNQDVKIHGYIFSSKKMLRTNLCKSYLLVVMASYVSIVAIRQSSMLNRSPMNFLDSLVFLVSIRNTFALCEELLHTLHKKICTHKIHLGVELLCNCILTNKGGSM